MIFQDLTPNAPAATMNSLKDRLLKACFELGLQIETEFSAVLKDGHELHTVARIPVVGAVNGMLVVRSYDEVRTHAEELIQAGYGYAVLEEPLPNEEFDLDSFREMFADWGWCGDPKKKPDWMP